MRQTQSTVPWQKMKRLRQSAGCGSKKGAKNPSSAYKRKTYEKLTKPAVPRGFFLTHGQLCLGDSVGFWMFFF